MLRHPRALDERRDRRVAMVAAESLPAVMHGVQPEQPLRRPLVREPLRLVELDARAADTRWTSSSRGTSARCRDRGRTARPTGRAAPSRASRASLASNSRAIGQPGHERDCRSRRDQWPAAASIRIGTGRVVLGMR